MQFKKSNVAHIATAPDLMMEEPVPETGDQYASEEVAV